MPDLPEVDGARFYPPLAKAQKGATQFKMEAQCELPSPEPADLTAADPDSGSGEGLHAELAKEMTSFIPWETES